MNRTKQPRQPVPMPEPRAITFGQFRNEAAGVYVYKADRCQYAPKTFGRSPIGGTIYDV